MFSEAERLHWAIGERLRSLREERGLSQEKLASLSGMHRTYVGKVERGESGITVDSVAMFCTALDVTLADFFEPFTGEARYAPPLEMVESAEEQPCRKLGTFRAVFGRTPRGG